VLAAKEAINRALETPLSEGLRFERRIFHGLFATHDQKEGMAAFVEKRPAKFKNE
jgi:enoyl-CoA hydratase